MKELPKVRPIPKLGPLPKMLKLSEMNLPPEAISEIHDIGRHCEELCRLMWELRASGWTPDKTGTHAADHNSTGLWRNSEPTELDY